MYIRMNLLIFLFCNLTSLFSQGEFSEPNYFSILGISYEEGRLLMKSNKVEVYDKLELLNQGLRISSPNSLEYLYSIIALQHYIVANKMSVLSGELGDEALRLFVLHPNSNVQARMHMQWGAMNTMQSNYDPISVLVNYKSAELIAHRTNNYTVLGNVYLRIARFYYHMDRVEQSDAYLDKWFGLFNANNINPYDSNEEQILFAIYNVLGTYYDKSYLSNKDFLNTSVNISHDDLHLKTKLYASSIALLMYSKAHDIASSLDMLDNLKSIDIQSENPWVLSIYYLSNGIYHSSLGYHKRAEPLLSKSYELIETNNYHQLKEWVLDGLLDVYRNTNQFDKFIKSAEELKLLRQTKYSSKINTGIYDLEKKFNTYEKSIVNRNQINKLNVLSDLKSSRYSTVSTYKYYVFELSMVLLGLLFLIYYYHYLVKRFKHSNHEFRIQIIEAQKINTHLLDNNIKIKELLYNLDKRLVLQALSSLCADTKIKSILLSLTDEKEIENYGFNIVKGLLNNNLRPNESRLELVNCIKRLYPKFLKQLQNKQLDITSKEGIYCLLLKLNLNLGEMALLLGVSVKSIEMIGYRLKRKFMLSSSQNVLNYISNLEMERL